MQRLANLVAAATAVAALLLIAGALDFQRRLSPTDRTVPVSQAAVFTGQFYRITYGLELMEAGHIERLLISGVNAGAGLSPESLVIRFGNQAPRLQVSLSEGRIDLDTIAQDTFGNARETACWYRRLGLVGPLLLVTSQAHQPRASIALEALLPQVEIRRADVPGRNRGNPWVDAFPRYLATRLLLLLDPSRRTASC